MTRSTGAFDPSAISYRAVSADDLDLICRHRHEMFKASGRADEMVQPSTTAFKEWVKPRLADGSYFGWIASAGGMDVAGLGMMVIDWPPHPSHPLQAQRGYILNVFVEAPYRSAGLARALMDLAMIEAKRRRILFMVLHATAMGAPLYEKLGWSRTTEMSISVSREEEDQ